MKKVKQRKGKNMPRKSKYIRVLRRLNTRITAPLEWNDRRKKVGLTWNEALIRGIQAAEHDKQYQNKDK